MAWGKRRIGVWALAAVAATVGARWGHQVAQHRLFRFGPHDQPVYDVEHNAVYDPGLAAWRDLTTYELHRYTPDSPLMPYGLPLLGAGCFAFFVFAVSWTVTHRRLVGHAYLAFVRQPVAMPLKFLAVLGMLGLSITVPFLPEGEDFEDLLSDRTTANFLGVTFGLQVLVPAVLAFVPWWADRMLGLLVIAISATTARPDRHAAGSGKQDALRRVVHQAERFRLSGTRDFASIAWFMRTEALISLLAERGNDTAALDDLLRDGPTAFGAPPRHLIDRLILTLGWPALETNVARAFVLRYEWTGAVVNLDRAIAVLDRLAAKPRPWFWFTFARWSFVCLNLTWALRHRYELREDPADLDRALALVRRVGRRYPNRVHGHVSELELLRYRATADPGALAAAIRAGRRAAPDPDTVRALLERFARDGDERDLAEAQELAARLVDEKGPGHPWHAACLMVHARVLSASGRSDAAADCLREAAGSASSPLQARLAAAMSLGELGAGGALAVEGYGAAVELLPQLAWIGLRRDDQRWLLRRWQGVSTAAAAAAIAVGRVEYAVEILEHGRAVMWGQLARLRDGVEAVRTADPALARRLDEIRAELDVPDETRWHLDEGGADVERRIRLGREWNELSARLGSAGRRDYHELSGAAANGPVVVVNASPLRCDAIVLLPDGEPVLVPLDRLDHGELVAWAEQSVDPNGRHQALLNVISARLWDDLAVPVLRAVTPTCGRGGGSGGARPDRWPPCPSTQRATTPGPAAPPCSTRSSPPTPPPSAHCSDRPSESWCPAGDSSSQRPGPPTSPTCRPWNRRPRSSCSASPTRCRSVPHASPTSSRSWATPTGCTSPATPTPPDWPWPTASSRWRSWPISGWTTPSSATCPPAAPPPRTRAPTTRPSTWPPCSTSSRSSTSWALCGRSTATRPSTRHRRCTGH